ncbi:MAG: nitrogen fixation protein NifB, partial [Prosthecochloris sp.]|nr:nitrogen fixation protein NifB [Prosthecochloris sp.]
MTLSIEKHPCFNDASRHSFGRIHLPVAPKCNIQCNYCNRKFDCLNENRPG